MSDIMTLNVESNEEPSTVIDRVRDALPGAIISVQNPHATTKDVLNVVEHAKHVFGSVEQAFVWLSEPNKVLGEKKPLEVLLSGQAASVEDILTRIEHGVYS